MARLCSALALLAASGALSAGCASGTSDHDTGGGRGPDLGAHDVGPHDAGPPVDMGMPKDSGLDAPMADTGPVCIDHDMDGYGMNCPAGADCNDMNAMISPAASEACNGMDDDCDGMIDEGLSTPIFCGVGACHTSVPTCMGGHTQTCTPLPAGTETCNGIDDDCDGMTDEGFGGSTCGIGACQRTVAACMGGMPPACVPGSPSPEVCNGIDDDCNTVVDDGLGTVSCGMGACRRSVAACMNGVPGTCVPGTPMPETCNGVDDNCNGVVDEGFGLVSCGLGACVRSVASCVMGMPMGCTPGTPTAEVCNGIDDDCDGTVDNGIPTISCGVGICLNTVPGCVGGTPGTCTPHPAMPSEVCGNGLDDNCNGQIDEGCSTCTPPSNSTCAAPLGYAIGSTVMGDNTCSGADLSSTCGAGAPGNDTTFTFSSDGGPTQYTITMTGPSSYDTVLHAHATSACNPTDELACTDDSGTINVSTIVLTAPPQGSVYLVADSYSTVGNSTFTLTSSSSALNNDTCGGAIPIRANGTYTGTTTGRNDDYSAGTVCAFIGNSAAPDVVYSITARSSGTITATLCGSSYDTLLYVSTSCGQADLACNDDSCGVQSSVSFSTSAGTTYYIVIDGYSTASGSYTLNITGY